MDRKAMVALIQARGVRDLRVLQAMARVSRQEFVPESRRNYAYGDHPLPIGQQQTISQPYIVAVMSEALALPPGQKVLEIGTGSGYQAAVLAEMGLEVYTVERIPELYEKARDSLAGLGYKVHCVLADGFYGLPEFSPYDGIIVTAAPVDVPQPLIDQLADKGRLVIPLGNPHSFQVLWKIVKQGDKLERFNLGGVAFVPFVHRG